jgi:hypothetical protein
VAYYVLAHHTPGGTASRPDKFIIIDICINWLHNVALFKAPFMHCIIIYFPLHAFIDMLFVIIENFCGFLNVLAPLLIVICT